MSKTSPVLYGGPPNVEITPPQSPPEDLDDRIKFRGLYMLVDAAVDMRERELREQKKSISACA
jgi:hypothetical protein